MGHSPESAAAPITASSRWPTARPDAASASGRSALGDSREPPGRAPSSFNSDVPRREGISHFYQDPEPQRYLDGLTTFDDPDVGDKPAIESTLAAPLDNPTVHIAQPARHRQKPRQELAEQAGRGSTRTPSAGRIPLPRKAVRGATPDVEAIWRAPNPRSTRSRRWRRCGAICEVRARWGTRRSGCGRSARHTRAGPSHRRDARRQRPPTATVTGEVRSPDPPPSRARRTEIPWRHR